MKTFKYKDDIRAWLEPMSYLEFWTAVDPMGLALQDRVHCDDQIARKLADEATVLKALKYMAADELSERLEISWRPATPWVKLVANH